MISKAPCEMFVMRADPLRGGVGGGLAPRVLWAPWKWHRADRRVPFGAHKTRFPVPTPLPLSQVMDLPASKYITLRTVP
jgi:hypothetical protein